MLKACKMHGAGILLKWRRSTPNDRKTYLTYNLSQAKANGVSGVGLSSDVAATAIK